MWCLSLHLDWHLILLHLAPQHGSSMVCAIQYVTIGEIISVDSLVKYLFLATVFFQVNWWCGEMALHKCDLCRKTFKRSYNLTVHKRNSHSNVKLVAICLLKNRKCAKSYSTKSNLQTHLKKHHKNTKIIGNKVRGKKIKWINKFIGNFLLNLVLNILKWT